MISPSSSPVRVLGIGGSTRTGSKSLIALKSALTLADEAGAVTELVDLHEFDLPMFNSDLAWSQYPSTVHTLIRAARQADAFFICSPTYHGTVSGAVKNALDLLDLMGGADGLPGQTLANKVVGLIAAGGGGGNVLTPMYHSVRALDAIVAPTVVSVSNGVVDVASGTITDASTIDRLRSMCTQVIDLATRLRVP